MLERCHIESQLQQKPLITFHIQFYELPFVSKRLLGYSLANQDKWQGIKLGSETRCVWALLVTQQTQGQEHSVVMTMRSRSNVDTLSSSIPSQEEPGGGGLPKVNGPPVGYWTRPFQSLLRRGVFSICCPHPRRMADSCCVPMVAITGIPIGHMSLSTANCALFASSVTDAHDYRW